MWIGSMATKVFPRQDHFTIHAGIFEVTSFSILNRVFVYRLGWLLSISSEISW
jgi:hypothetical protein